MYRLTQRTNSDELNVGPYKPGYVYMGRDHQEWVVIRCADLPRDEKHAREGDAMRAHPGNCLIPLKYAWHLFPEAIPGLGEFCY